MLPLKAKERERMVLNSKGVDKTRQPGCSFHALCSFSYKPHFLHSLNILNDSQLLEQQHFSHTQVHCFSIPKVKLHHSILHILCIICVLDPTSDFLCFTSNSSLISWPFWILCMFCSWYEPSQYSFRLY